MAMGMEQIPHNQIASVLATLHLIQAFKAVCLEGRQPVQPSISIRVRDPFKVS